MIVAANGFIYGFDRYEVRDAIQTIEDDGWFQVAMRGSHLQ